jgi:hypothetical protein
MSYEGYVVKLYVNGHRRVYDPLDFYFSDGPSCECGVEWVWEASVDQTNGADPKTGMCPGEERLAELEVAKEPSRCPTCDQTTSETLYRVRRA